MIGQVIGNYRIVSELGKGGMGMVYRAEHIQLGKPAALKMLLPQLTSDPSIVQRFFNEARAASAIDHPGIVEVFDFGTHTDGAAYIVMALLKGESLEHRLQRGALPPLEGASIVAQVLGALAAAHARGIVHRDLKPDNIFLTPNDLMPGGIQVKLLDFGIAKLADEKSAGFKTQTGMMMGTPAYMSPEQCMGAADLDHRTDLYAIGCILFHVLTGRPPFMSDQGTGMMIAAHIRDPAPHPRTLNPNIPDSLAAIVLRLLEKEPAARYQSALEVREALVAAGASAPSRPPVPFDQYAATIAPMPSSFGTAPTTASGSAGQLITAQATVTPVRSKTGLVLGLAVLAAAGLGVGVWAAMRGANTPAEVATLAPDGSNKPADKNADKPADKPAEPPITPAGRPVENSAVVAAADQPQCPLGKVRGFDTHGQCCWPEQAFSTAKSRCVGTPACPDGHKVTGEECAVVIAASTQEAKPVPGSPTQPARPIPSPPKLDPQHPSPAPTYTLDRKTYAARDPIVITFATPVPSPSNSRAWITIVEAGKPPSQYGAWTYIDDGAKSAKLTAPDVEGAYEVRMHTDYPSLSTNVRHSVPVTVGTPVAKAVPKNERFMLAAKVARAGTEVEVTFPGAMKAATGERYWVTVVEKGSKDSDYGAYAYVPDGARTVQLGVPKQAGEYEVRMHANYPRLSTNVVHRALIRVED